MPACLIRDRHQRRLRPPRQMRMRKRRFLPKPPKTSQRMNPTTWTRPRKRQSQSGEPFRSSASAFIESALTSALSQSITRCLRG